MMKGLANMSQIEASSVNGGMPSGLPPAAPQPASPPPAAPQPSGPPPAAISSVGLRRDIRRVTLVLFAIVVTVQLASAMVAVIAMLFSPQVYDLVSLVGAQGSGNPFDLANDAQYQRLMSEAMTASLGVASIVGIIIGALWLLLLRRPRDFAADIKHTNQRMTAASFLKMLCLIFGVGFVSTLISLALEPLLQLLGLSLTAALEGAMSSIAMTPAGLLYGILIGPVVEELIFRSMILRRLQPYGANFAILVSALLFGAWHMILIQGFFAFFIGLILAYVALRYSLRHAILLHIINNATSFAIGLAFGMLPQTDATALASLVFDLAFQGLFFVIAAVILVKGRRNAAAIRQAGAPALQKPYGVAFSSPFLLVLLVVLLGAGFLMLGVPSPL
jgi:membrane protease YdiL (CAAX protease family)